MTIKEVFNTIQEKKKEQRELNKHVRETLAGSNEYQEIKEKISNLREKKKAIEESAKAPYQTELDKLAIDITDYTQNLSDIAVTSLMKGESVEVLDTENGKFEPIISVKYKKAK